MVGHQILDLTIGVRVPAPQHMSASKILVRKMVESDLVQVSTVVQRSMLPSLSLLSAEIIKQKLDRNSPDRFLVGRETVEYFVAEQENKILGVVGLDSEEIRTFYVDPLYQGKGIGRLLYNKLIELVGERKIKELIVRSSPVAEPVYKALGFEPVEKIWKTQDDGSKSFTILMRQDY